MYKQAWPAVEAPELRGAYVGFWARLWASFLDTILTIIVTYPFLIAVYGWGYLESRPIVEGPIDLLLSWMLPAAAIVMFWIYCSATPGKMAIGARIVDAATGRQPTQWQFIKRYMGYVLSSIPLCWGFIRAAFDSRKQGWHDKLAGTVVVYTRRIWQPEISPKPKTPAMNPFVTSFHSYSVAEEFYREEVVIGAP